MREHTKSRSNKTSNARTHIRDLFILWYEDKAVVNFNIIHKKKIHRTVRSELLKTVSDLKTRMQTPFNVYRANFAHELSKRYIVYETWVSKKRRKNKFRVCKKFAPRRCRPSAVVRNILNVSSFWISESESTYQKAADELYELRNFRRFLNIFRLFFYGARLTFATAIPRIASFELNMPPLLKSGLRIERCNII